LGLFKDGLAPLFKYYKPKLTLRNDRMPVKKTSRYTKAISKRKYRSFKTIVNT
jgi:hypothetical protein